MTLTIKKKYPETASAIVRSARQNRRDERRAHARFSSNIQSRIFFGNMIYSGMIKNLSKSGMFVSTRVHFPVNSEFIVVALMDKRTVRIPIKVRRSAREDDGMGVELLELPRQYLDYVNRCESILSPSLHL